MLSEGTNAGRSYKLILVNRHEILTILLCHLGCGLRRRYFSKTNLQETILQGRLQALGIGFSRQGERPFKIADVALNVQPFDFVPFLFGFKRIGMTTDKQRLVFKPFEGDELFRFHPRYLSNYEEVMFCFGDIELWREDVFVGVAVDVVVWIAGVLDLGAEGMSVD
jgi:hypothetical protein